MTSSGSGDLLLIGGRTGNLDIPSAFEAVAICPKETLKTAAGSSLTPIVNRMRCFASAPRWL